MRKDLLKGNRRLKLLEFQAGFRLHSTKLSYRLRLHQQSARLLAKTAPPPAVADANGGAGGKERSFVQAAQEPRVPSGGWCLWWFPGNARGLARGAPRRPPRAGALRWCRRKVPRECAVLRGA